MNISRALIAVLLLGPAANGYPQITAADNSSHPSTHPSVNISISTAATTQFKLGTPIRLKVVLTNISGKEIFVGKEVSYNDLADYDVFVVNDHGESAPTTALHRFLSGKRRPDDPRFYFTHSRQILLVHPGQSLKSGIDLETIYKISQPGTYKIWVERQDGISNQRIKSNEITITVTP